MKALFELAQAASVGGNQVDCGHSNHQMKASQSLLFPHGSTDASSLFSFTHDGGNLPVGIFLCALWTKALAVLSIALKINNIDPRGLGEIKGKHMNASTSTCPCKIAGFLSPLIGANFNITYLLRSQFINVGSCLKFYMKGKVRIFYVRYVSLL